MYYYSLLIYPILLLTLLLWGVKRVPANEQNDQFLSLSQTKMLQVFACIGVILHHVTQTITYYGTYYKGPITILSSMGILFTSIFFFCSGYGLYISYTTKPEYLKNFLSHRLSVILVPFITANALFVIVYSINNKITPGFINILKYTFGISLINSNSWFIIEIAILYIAFYILFRLIKHKDFALSLLVLFTICLILFAKGRGHDTNSIVAHSSYFRGEWWYNSTIAFAVGLIFARFRRQLVAIISRFYRCIVVIAAILFVIVFVVEEYILKTHGYYKDLTHIDGISDSTITLLWQMALCTIFIILTLLISYKIRFSNKCLTIISGVCTELYLVHHLFVADYANGLSINGHARYLFALVPSFAVAFILAKINKVILKLLTSFFDTLGTLFYDVSFRPSKKTKRCFICVAVIGILIACFYLLNLKVRLFAGREYKEEIAMLKEAKEGDVVLYGYYDTSHKLGKERLEWIVLSIDGNRYTLITKHGISSSFYYQKHEKATWDSSHIRALINSNEFYSIFSKKELELIKENTYGERISLLTATDAEKYFNSNEDRILTSTEIAKDKGVNVNTLSKTNQWDYKDDKSSWWWLRGTNDKPELTAPIVSCDGEILLDEKYVNKPHGAIRPVLIIELD